MAAGWPRAKPAIPHWYLLGEAAAPGFRPLAGLYQEGPAPEPPAVGDDDVFAVISTAAMDLIPRGAALTHANVIAANLTILAASGLGPSDRYLVALPLFHITALGWALAVLHAGGASVVMTRFDGDEAARLIDRHQITHLSDFLPCSPPCSMPRRSGEPAGEPQARLGSRRPRPSSDCTRRRARISGPDSVSRRPAASCPSSA